MIVHLKSRVTSPKQTLIRQSRLYSGMTCHSPVFLTTKGSHSHTVPIGNKLLQISIPGSDSFPRLPNTHPYAMTEPTVPFLYPTFETCQLKIVEPTTDIPSQTLFTIFVAPAVITAGEFTYLTLHLLDTIGMDVELAFAITTTKGIRKEFDVTHISDMGLLLIHL